MNFCVAESTRPLGDRRPKLPILNMEFSRRVRYSSVSSSARICFKSGGNDGDSEDRGNFELDDKTLNACDGELRFGNGSTVNGGSNDDDESSFETADGADGLDGCDGFDGLDIIDGFKSTTKRVESNQDKRLCKGGIIWAHNWRNRRNVHTSYRAKTSVS